MWEFKSASSGMPSGTSSGDSHLLTEPLPKQRRARGMTYAKLTARIALGHGLGSGSRYIPWLMLRKKNPSPDSNQVISRMPPLGRTAHYFSRGEYHTALFLLWLGVEDLREQFPIWPIPHPHPLESHGTMQGKPRQWSRGLLAIAADAGVKHGVEFGTNVPYVASLDLLATTRHGGRSALTIFSSKPIDSPEDDVRWRTLERLELERRYAIDIAARYYVSSAALVSVLTAGQLETWLDASSLRYFPHLANYAVPFAASFNESKALSIIEAVRKAASQCSLDLDQAWFLFRHCAWTQAIDIDPTVRMLHSYPARPGGRALRQAWQQQLFGETWT
jgi:hypothetical protein